MRYYLWSLAHILFGLSLLPFFPSDAVGQLPRDTTNLHISDEILLEDLDPMLGDATHLTELLTDLLEQPLDINMASTDELAQIPPLGIALAHRIVQHRTTSGPFSALDDLRAVEGMTEATIHAARPFLTTGAMTHEITSVSPSRRQALQIEWLQRAGRRLDLGRGYADDSTRTTYSGSPTHLYARLRVRSPHLRFNLTVEKDPGEPFLWDPATRIYGFDHLTAHLAFHDIGPLNTLVVGDFVANWGQGVVFWRSSSMSKGRDPVRPLVRAGHGIMPYGSTDENRFFRGLAATVRLTPTLSFSALASRRTLDASLRPFSQPENNGLNNVITASSLSESGLHRTPSEMSRRDAVREDLVGGTIDVQSGAVRAGMVGYHSQFDRPLTPGDAAYQRYQFAGRRGTMVGAYTRFALGHLYLFGEAAHAPTGAIGGLAGLTTRPTDRAELLILTRYYPQDFVSLHGYAFGEQNGATQNESGIYLGLQLHLSPTWRVAAYVDQYRFPWVRFGVPRPSTGFEVFALIEHRPRRWLTVYVQGKSETKERSVTDSDVRNIRHDALLPETRQSLRLHGDYRFSPQLRMRARLEGVRVATHGSPNTYGVVLFQDVRWHPSPTLQLDIRLAFFDTNHFDARVFTYEHDLLYTFSVPAFSGRGQRTYALLSWTPSPHLMLQVKVAATRFEDVSTVGTALEMVDGNRLREVRAQLRLRI